MTIINLSDRPNKRCTKCKQVKPIKDFAFNKARSSGRQDHCRPCQAENNRLYCRNNPDYLAYRSRLYRIRNLKYDAQNCVKRAIEQGKILPAYMHNCEICGKQAEHHHHCDYHPSKWLDTMPLCARCHCAWHRENEPLNTIYPQDDLFDNRETIIELVSDRRS